MLHLHVMAISTQPITSTARQRPAATHLWPESVAAETQRRSRRPDAAHLRSTQRVRRTAARRNVDGKRLRSYKERKTQRHGETTSQKASLDVHV